MKQLSKSKYAKFCQCPKCLWMSTYKPEEQQRTRKALLDYCCLDTFAMVKVWEKLKETD